MDLQNSSNSDESIEDAQTEEIEVQQEVQLEEEVLAYNDDAESATEEQVMMTDEGEFASHVEEVEETVANEDVAEEPSDAEDESGHIDHSDEQHAEVDPGVMEAEEAVQSDAEEAENEFESGAEEAVESGAEEAVGSDAEEAVDSNAEEAVDSDAEEAEEAVVSGGEDDNAPLNTSANHSMSSGDNTYEEGSKHQSADFDDVVDVEDEKTDEFNTSDQNVNYHESEANDFDDDDKINKNLQSDDEIGSDAEKPAEVGSPTKRVKKIDSDGEEEEEDVAKDIADIFGDSGDEDDGEEFTGFDKSVDKKRKVVSDSDDDNDEKVDPEKDEAERQQQDSDSDDDRPEHSSEYVSEFDRIMQKKKAEKKSRRRNDGGTNISDVDDIVNRMLLEMKTAADDDREAVKNGLPALNKLKMLKRVVTHINKQDMRESFIDMGIYSAISDWLTPIKDLNLPHLSIRRELLKVLQGLPTASAETLTSSKVGRAVMLIFKHPKEIRANKEMAGRLINKWSRPLFGLNENFKSMSRDEREQRDLHNMPKKRKNSDSQAGTSSSADPTAAGESDVPLRPGDKGFVMRARVPMPSNRDYVVRPKWKVNQESGDGESSFRQVKKSKAKKDSRLDKHIKNFAEQKKRRKMQRACAISIEGNRMKLA